MARNFYRRYAGVGGIGIGIGRQDRTRSHADVIAQANRARDFGAHADGTMVAQGDGFARSAGAALAEGDVAIDDEITADDVPRSDDQSGAVPDIKARADFGAVVNLDPGLRPHEMG